MNLSEENNLLAVARGVVPTEPFPCPECGQMLAPTCRVCVACKAPVDYRRVDGKKVAIEDTETVTHAAPASLEPARFSWSMFFTVLLGYFFIASLCQAWLGIKGSYYAMGSFVLATSFWVYLDAREKEIHRPAGWALACVLLWIVFFPWYLSRRRTPLAPCPIIEGEAGPVTRAIILFLVILTIFGAMLMFVTGDFPFQVKNTIRPEKARPTLPAPHSKPGTHKSQP